MGEPRFEVVWPQGTVASAPPIALAPRLPDLSGKRLALVWDHVFRGDEMFAAFQDVVRARYADVSFVAHEAFGNVHGSIAEEHEAIERLPDRLRELEVDAAVVGVGA